MTPLIAYVKGHARDHYDDGGWDVIVECFTDAEIEEVLREAGATTEAEAIKAFEPLVEVWAEREADAAHHRREALGDDDLLDTPNDYGEGSYYHYGDELS